MRKITFIGIITLLVFVTSCKKEETEVAPSTTTTTTTTTTLVVSNLSTTIAENPLQDEVLDTLIATGDNVQFSFLSQSVSSALQIDENTGVISVLTPSVFDFEQQTSLSAEINVSNGKDTIVATVTVTITDVDETPTLLTAQDLDITIEENPEEGQILGTIVATGDDLNFSFVNAKQNLIYQIDEATGELSVLLVSRFDYENGSTLSTEVNVTNGIDTLVSTVTISFTNVIEIGDFYKGGIVFWLNPEDSTEGLVCALEDQSASATWGCEGTLISGADSKLLGDGNQNTIEIDAGCTTTGIAADLCANLSLNNYSDWYLPSENELAEVYTNIGTVNSALEDNQGTAIVRANGGGPYYSGAFYWSSSEHIAQSAILYDFSAGSGYIATKGSLYRVRAIRSF